jgi:hypothetical protein
MKLWNRLIMVTSLIIVLVGGATWAWAESGDGVIKACVSEQGKVRIVNHETDCKEGDGYLEWNIVGPPGPPGPPGGVMVFYKMLEETRVAPGWFQLDVECFPGDIATGGGFNVEREIEVGGCRPGPTDEGWALEGWNTDTTPRMATVYVVCADMGP